MPHGLANYKSSNLPGSLKASISLYPIVLCCLDHAPVTNISAYIQKLPDVTGDDIPELDAHLAQSSMRLTPMGVVFETKH